MYDEEDDEELLEDPEPEEEPQTERLDWPGAEPKQAAFLTAYVTLGGRICRAARAARINRTMHYRWMKADANYKELFREAELQAADVLEAEAKRRALDGWYEPVYYQGEECGRVLRFSDGLMQTLLKGAKPDKYRERHEVEHTGTVNVIERLAAGRKRVAEAKKKKE